jgi:hypothetical protein
MAITMGKRQSSTGFQGRHHKEAMKEGASIMSRCNWTLQETELLIEYYPHRSTKEVAFITGKSIAQCYAKAFALQLHKTPEYLATEASGRLKKGNVGTQFTKGNVPWNKGMKGLQIGGEETRFKKGTVPHNHKSVASERIDEDGYTYIKIADPRKWVLKHRYIYEQHHGTLEPHMIVTFRDKNISNFEIENLEAITKVENMQRNTITKYPQPIRETIKTLNKLWHAIKSKT